MTLTLIEHTSEKYSPRTYANARLLYRYCKQYDIKTLNIAGNGIYTLLGYGWGQCKVNQFVYDVLRPVTEHLLISSIMSGGQTGVDIAGLVAAYKLGIPCTGLFPKGFIMRDFTGVDRSYPKEQIESNIIGLSRELEDGSE